MDDPVRQRQGGQEPMEEETRTPLTDEEEKRNEEEAGSMDDYRIEAPRFEGEGPGFERPLPER